MGFRPAAISVASWLSPRPPRIAHLQERIGPAPATRTSRKASAQRKPPSSHGCGYKALEHREGSGRKERCGQLLQGIGQARLRQSSDQDSSNRAPGDRASTPSVSVSLL